MPPRTPRLRATNSRARADEPAPYTAEQLAKLGGVSRDTVLRWVRRGIVTGVGDSPATMRFGFPALARVRAVAALIAQAPGQRRAVLAAAARGARLRCIAGAVVEADDAGVWETRTGQGVLPIETTESATLRVIEPERRVDPAALLTEALAREGDDPARAVELYRRVVALGGETLVEACVNLGRLHHLMGHTADAIAAYERALREDPECARAWFNLGVALQDSGDRGAAREAYEDALRRDPRLADAHYNAATVCEDLGDHRAALRHLQAYRRLTQS